jgi:hypothetical protein
MRWHCVGIATPSRIGVFRLFFPVSRLLLPFLLKSSVPHAAIGILLELLLADSLGMRWHCQCNAIEVHLADVSLGPLDAEQSDVRPSLLVGHCYCPRQEIVSVELKRWCASFGISAHSSPSDFQNSIRFLDASDFAVCNRLQSWSTHCGAIITSAASPLG